MTTHLVWLRNDLRINDNLALHAACNQPDANVIALFIATPGQWQQHEMAPRQAAFIHQNLCILQSSLAERGIPLHFHQCDDFAASIGFLVEFCQKQQVDRLFYNYQYEVNERERDARAEKRLHEVDVVCQGFDDSVLLSPGSIQTGDGEMYKVFTPFSRAFLRRLQQGLPECVPAPKARAGAPLSGQESIPPFDYPHADIDASLFPPGEQAAIKRLREFAKKRFSIIQRSAICLRWTVPVVCRAISLSGCSRHGNACIASSMNSRKHWITARLPYGSMN